MIRIFITVCFSLLMTTSIQAQHQENNNDIPLQGIPPTHKGGSRSSVIQVKATLEGGMMTMDFSLTCEHEVEIVNTSTGEKEIEFSGCSRNVTFDVSSLNTDDVYAIYVYIGDMTFYGEFQMDE